MNKAETVAGALFAVLGAFMMLESLKVPYLIEGVPGPSFLPRWIAVGLLVSGAVLAIKAAFPRFGSRAATEWPAARGWMRVVLVMAALAVAFVVLDKLGFLVTTTLFMLVVIFGLGVRSWLALATVPLVAAIGLYMVFGVWLSVPLPKGLLGGL